MNRTQAIAKLRPILGKSIAWRENEKAPTGDQREAAIEALRTAQQATTAARKALDERYKVVLGGDAEYQRLKAAYQAAYDASGKAAGVACRHRVTVGTANSMFFHVKAEGDNWQEVVDKLTR